MSAEYQEFVSRKLAKYRPVGLREIPPLPDSLLPLQSALVPWALRRGRCAIFADTGLGKSRMEISWGHALHTALGIDVLMLTPLAVAKQMIAHHDSKLLQLLMDAFSETPYKLCASATPAPNDWTELGTHAEFLGVCRRTEMLSEFFVHDGGETQVWRLKGHAQDHFWEWVASWAAMVRRPSDLGFDDTLYKLPPLQMHEHASPVWMDINSTRTLNYRAARDEQDEKHICPLALDIIERGLELWSKPGDVVLSPFMGIGSEGFVATQMGRKFVGVELKASYYEQAKRNLRASIEQQDMFA